MVYNIIFIPTYFSTLLKSNDFFFHLQSKASPYTWNQEEKNGMSKNRRAAHDRFFPIYFHSIQQQVVIGRAKAE